MRYLTENDRPYLQSDQVGILIPNKLFDNVLSAMGEYGIPWVYSDNGIRPERTNRNIYMGVEGPSGPAYITFRRWNDDYLQYLGELFADAPANLIEEDRILDGVQETMTTVMADKYGIYCDKSNTIIKLLWYPDATFLYSVHVHAPATVKSNYSDQFNMEIKGHPAVITTWQMSNPVDDLIDKAEEENAGYFQALRQTLYNEGDSLFKIGVKDLDKDVLVKAILEIEKCRQLCHKIEENWTREEQLDTIRDKVANYQNLAYKSR